MIACDHSQHSNFEQNQNWYSKNSQTHLHFDLNLTHDLHLADPLSINHCQYQASANLASTTNFNGLFNFFICVNPFYFGYPFNAFIHCNLDLNPNAFYFSTNYPYRSLNLLLFFIQKLQFSNDLFRFWLNLLHSMEITRTNIFSPRLYWKMINHFGSIKCSTWHLEEIGSHASDSHFCPLK